MVTIHILVEPIGDWFKATARDDIGVLASATATNRDKAIREAQRRVTHLVSEDFETVVEDMTDAADA